MALSGSRGGLPGLAYSCLSVLGLAILGAYSLASPGLLGAVMVVVFLGWILLMCLGTNLKLPVAPPGLGVGWPDEEGTLHASVQGLLQQWGTQTCRP